MASIFEYSLDLSFPGGDSGKEPIYQSRRHKRRGFDPWVGKIPWMRYDNILQYVVQNRTQLSDLACMHMSSPRLFSPLILI